jgi:hypothetical protein
MPYIVPGALDFHFSVQIKANESSYSGSPIIKSQRVVGFIYKCVLAPEEIRRK